MARTLFTTKFWGDALERAIKSFAQAAVLVMGQDVTGVDVFQADWQNVVGFGVGGAVLSILTSIISAPFGEPGTASLVTPKE
jgi:hypothetical protein